MHSAKDYSADLIHQHALNWLKHQQKGKPFFGVFTYTLPHAELTQPNDSLVAFYKKKFFEDKTWGGQEGSRYNAVEHTHAQFAAMISRLDAYVGEILRTLDEQGLADNTLVIFTSDNGPHERVGLTQPSSIVMGNYEDLNDSVTKEVFVFHSLPVGKDILRKE